MIQGPLVDCIDFAPWFPRSPHHITHFISFHLIFFHISACLLYSRVIEHGYFSLTRSHIPFHVSPIFQSLFLFHN